jgi:hypothetical protein
MRSLDPRIQDWFDSLLDWLAPDWTTNDAQPLPAVPSIDTSISLPLPLPAAPAPPPVPALAEKDLPRVPSRPGVRRRWRAIWIKIKPLVDEGASSGEIEAWFAGHDVRLRPSKKTLDRIIAAGQAGLLDED